MSIRIDSDSLTGATAAQAGKTDQIGSAGTKSAFGLTRQGAGRDSVEMSSIAQELLGAAAAQDADRAGRINQLAAAYASGSYQPNSLNVSRAMVAQAINAPSESGLE